MQVTIRRFKNIENVTLDSDGITLLIGGNNAGKSSILQAIQFGVSAAQTSILQQGRWNLKKNKFSTSIGQSDLVYSPIKDILSLARNGSLKEKADEAIVIIFKDGNNECTVSVRKGKNKNILIDLTGISLGQKLQSLEKPFSALVTGLAGIPPEEKLEARVAVRKAAANGHSNSVFRNILLLLKEDDDWATFQSQVEAMFPGYVIEVEYERDKSEFISCMVNRGGRRYPIDSCGTGALQAMQIFAYANLFKPRIMLLDEPDSHLHPNNQKLIAGMLVKISRGGTDVILCSHSRHIISALFDDAGFIWMRGGKRVEDAEKYEIQTLIEIGALSAGERIADPSFVFLTEDTDADLLKLVLSASGYDINRCIIMSYDGCTNLATATVLINLLKRSYPSAKYVVHRDRDFLTQEYVDKFVHNIQKLGAAPFIPQGNDIESYFTNPEHISSACSISLDDANLILSSAYEARKSSLRSSYINTVVSNQLKASMPANSGEIANTFEESCCLGSAVIHGKTLLKGVRDELRERQISDEIMKVSTYLAVPELIQLRSDL